MYTLGFYLAIVNKVLRHCHSWLARKYRTSATSVSKRAKFVAFALERTVVWFVTVVLLNVPVKSYVHVGTVSSPSHNSCVLNRLGKVRIILAL